MAGTTAGPMKRSGVEMASGLLEGVSEETGGSGDGDHSELEPELSGVSVLLNNKTKK